MSDAVIDRECRSPVVLDGQERLLPAAQVALASLVMVVATVAVLLLG